MVGNKLSKRDVAAPVAFSDEAFQRVRDGMVAVTNEPGGSAYPWRITEAGYEMAGKTGTAQVRVFTKEEHARGITKNENLDWKLRDHGLFIGFAPIVNPKYAIVCVIEHGATVAHVQVQMARDILLFAQKRGTLDKPTAYPVKAAERARTNGGG